MSELELGVIRSHVESTRRLLANIRRAASDVLAVTGALDGELQIVSRECGLLKEENRKAKGE